MSVLMHSINIGVTAFEKAQILFDWLGFLLTQRAGSKGASQDPDKQRESWKTQQKKRIHLHPMMDLTST